MSGQAVQRYVDEWIQAIHDVTPLAKQMHTLLPLEKPYPIPERIKGIIGSS
jgi:hypothetical protein